MVPSHPPRAGGRPGPPARRGAPADQETAGAASAAEIRARLRTDPIFPRLHLILNAHLDPVWQWRWEEGSAAALSTFRTAAEILRERPELVFNHNEAVLYRWVERYDPGLFEEIRALVREGRWVVAGGWDLQPDLNLPGFEALVRHVLDGRLWFRERFGVEPRVAWNFDSFGHPAGLPQLLRQAGYRLYIHMRPQAEELALPGDLYRWRGADGTEILAYRIAVGLYHTERWNIEERLREGTELALRLGRAVPVFWGLGDHGGGPTREDLDRIDAFRARETRVEIIHSSPERFLDAIEEAGREAPVFEGELQRSFPGCYTSLARLKRRARANLGTLVGAEALATAAWWLRGASYPEEELRDAWRDHLFNDFHDILPGSATASAEADALDLYGRSSETARRARLGAVAALAGGRARGPAGTIPLVVAHTVPSATRAPVEAECMLDERPRLEGAWHLELSDDAGRPIPIQEEEPESLLPFGGWRRKIAFLADLPGTGTRRYWIEVRPGAPRSPPKPPAIPWRLGEASGLVESLDLAGAGAIAGGNLLAGPLLSPLVVRDEADSWGSGVSAWREVVGRFELASGPRAIERGSVRTIFESVLEFGRSRIVLHAIAWHERPAIEVRLRVHWNEERRMLKLAVPLALERPRLLVEVPGGAIERPADGTEQVFGRWLLAEGSLGGRPAALGIASDGPSGLDFDGRELRISALRSPAYCHERGFALGEGRAWRFMDQGVHEIRFAVTSGSPEEVRARLPGLADLLERPPFALAHLPLANPQTSHAPSGGIAEALAISPPAVRLLALKRSEDGRALVARVQEAAGLPTGAELRVAGVRAPIPLALRPFEAKTVRVERSGAWKEVGIFEET